MERILTDAQARVLGSMMEKRITTPQYYPMTQSAVRTACNQKSARDPVVDYSENDVFDILRSLSDLGYVKHSFVDSSRTAKYEHQFEKVNDFGKEEIAILCELFLRGPQTAGELRAHCERLHGFKDIPELERSLEGLAAKGRVVLLAKVSGYKEQRWAHRFCGEPANVAPPAVAEPEASGLKERVEALEAELGFIKRRLEALEGGKTV